MGPRPALAYLMLLGLIATSAGVHAGAIYGSDADLADSTASFYGEVNGDGSGCSVAIAGDVNGDGYDDILIGADHNGESEVLAGQTYLVLGNASGWSMDVDISEADASFLGEANDDRSGYSVAGAGDVNGDDYDDILIGARYNDEGGASAGQVYLFLGKATGWANDTDLSTADASFWGEVPYDCAGHSVAGAGDVNGDGYDDILIGSTPMGISPYTYRNVGVTHLVLGKASGWSRDTSLSNADASFLGEGYDDEAGLCVAGAGDVNRDGFDDVLIGAWKSDENGQRAGQAYLVLGKDSGWSMNTSLADADASFLGEAEGDSAGHSVDGAGDVNGDGYDDIVIGAYKNDEGGSTGDVDAGQVYLVLGKAGGWAMDTGLSNADASFLGEAGGDQAGQSVAGAGDVDADGFDDILIGAPWSDAGGDRSGQVYLVLGASAGWSMDTDLGDADASFWGEAAGDTAGLAVDGAGDLNGDGYHDLLVGVYLRSDRGEDRGETYVILYFDGAPPEFGVDATPAAAHTGDPFTFSVEVTDDIELTDARVEYWFEDWPHRNESLVPRGSDLWNLTVHVPANTLGPLHYLFYAVDNASNWNVTGVRNVTVVDDKAPHFNTDLSDTTATTGDPFDFLINVTDNINLTEVRVVYWFGTGVERNVSMDPGPGDDWDLTITVPSDSLDTLHYRFYAVDNSSNVAVSGTTDVTVTDNDAPVLGVDNTPGTGTTGDEFTFSIEVTDNIAVANVTLRHSYGEGPTIVTELARGDGDAWEVTFPLDHTIEDLNYSVTARDRSGNEVASSTRDVTISDNDPPAVVEDLSDATATTGDVYTARIRVHDNMGIDTVKTGAVPWTAVDVDGRGNGLYEWETTIPDEWADPSFLFHLEVEVMDESGNELTYTVNTPAIVDNDPPEFVDYLTNKTAVKGTNFIFYVRVVGNFIPPNMPVYVEYRIGEGPLENDTMLRSMGLNQLSCSHNILIPRDAEGALVYRFVAVDGDDNWNRTEEIRAPIVNVAPLISPLPQWNVTEGTDAEFDMTTYISDLNDDTFTLECSDDNVTIEGMVLRVRHDIAVPDRIVTVQVSDGENATQADLTIHVVNVNDAPEIIGRLPATGTKYKEGKAITLSVNASDEDGDGLSVTWWDGDVEIGTGSPLEVKLEPGEHIITVVVTDGTDRVDDTFTVVVKKEEDSPGLGPVVALAALVLAGLVVRRRR